MFFLPDDRVFSLGDVSTLKMYGKVCIWAHWHILARLATKAQIFVGAAQLAVDMLGTGHIPGVRALVADIMEYAMAPEGLRAFRRTSGAADRGPR